MSNAPVSKKVALSYINDEVASPGSVPALDRSLDICELLSASPTGLTLSELADELGFPKNAVFRITQTLLARGYLSRDASTRAFHLTQRMLRLSPPHWAGVSLPALARDSMTALRDATRETIQLGVPNGLEGVIIDQVTGLEPLRIAVDLGLRFPLHNNAPGKLLLAHQSNEQRAETFSQIKLTASTPRTITTKKELVAECERIVANGYSTDYAEADEGIHCIAGPIFGPEKGTARDLVGTLWITGPAKRLPKSRFKELGELAAAAGARVTRRIGAMV